MAEMMTFELVSPERMVASFEASQIEIPGSEGDFTAMPDHQATVTTLRPGVIRATGRDGAQEFIVSGGFVEVTADTASVLAEVAVARADVTRDLIDGLLREAEASAEGLEGLLRDTAEKHLADTRALADRFAS